MELKDDFKFNIPYTYKKVDDDKQSSINADKLSEGDDNELILFEIPKNVKFLFLK